MLASERLTAEHRTILATARGATSADLEVLVESADPEVLIGELHRLRVLGLLGPRLIDGAADAVDRRVGEAVEAVLAFGRRDAMVKQVETWELVLRLERAGIPAMALKGPFLAERLHGDAAVRLSHDIDVLVPRQTLSAAVAVIEAAGWVRPRVSDDLPKLHHIFVHPGSGRELELHWRTHWNDRDYPEQVFAESIVSKDGVRRPSPADELTLLLLAHARDGLIGLRTPTDIDAAVSNDPAAVGEVGRRLAGHVALQQPVIAAALATQRLLGTPLDGLLPADGMSRRVRMALRLADWRLDDAGADTSAKLVDAFLTPRHEVGSYVRRQFLPIPPTQGRGVRASQVLHAAGLARRMAPLALRVRSGVTLNGLSEAGPFA